MTHQKLDYIHYNPVEAGFVTKIEEWKYSSGMDLPGGRQVTMDIRTFENHKAGRINAIKGLIAQIPAAQSHAAYLRQWGSSSKYSLSK